MLKGLECSHSVACAQIARIKTEIDIEDVGANGMDVRDGVVAGEMSSSTWNSLFFQGEQKLETVVR